MEAHAWDAFLTADRRTCYYFTGVLSPLESAIIFVMWADGRTGLVSGIVPTGSADFIELLEVYSIHRSIDFLDHDAAAALGMLLAGGSTAYPTTWGVEKPSVHLLIEASLRTAYPQAQIIDAGRTLLRLRKKKEDDEIATIRDSLRYCRVAYDAARGTIAPGISECDVYNAMQSAINCEAGTRVDLPGDFACGERGIAGGGPPTPRKLQRGDLYPLDMLPAPFLYCADTCRTFAVGEPSDLQHRAWEVTMQAVRKAESMIRPGVRARDVYKEIKGFLDSVDFTEKSFWHHVGHGLGHRGHEAPRIIPGSDDVFEEGDVFTIEPGVYTQALQGGIRLEDDYVVHANGIEDLFDYPWGL
jgi:Xaa-Pro dipeptidase